MAQLDPWYERFFDGLYGQVLPATFTEVQTRKQLAIVRRLLRLRKGQRVLDIPCGMGRLTIPLARGGLKMTGVDLSPSYVRRARRAARGLGPAIRFVRADMRRIDFDGEFDAAFNWFGSFGYFSDADNLRFAGRVLAALRPAGRFLVEGVNKSWLRTHFVPTGEEVVGGVRIKHRRRWNRAETRILDTWIFSRGTATERHTSSIRVFNGGELRALLRAAGFREIELFGYPPLARLTRHSHQLIALATRPAST
jgi:cyclopropane fatty-acyl-phospholipid synthase-like methyltransferase